MQAAEPFYRADAGKQSQKQKGGVRAPDGPFPGGERWSSASFASSRSPMSGTSGLRCCSDRLHGDRSSTAASWGPQRGGHGEAFPSPPHRDTMAPGVHSHPPGSMKIEIPQVANVWRNPEKTNWFSPHPPFNACWLSLCIGNCCSAPIKRPSPASCRLDCELILHTYLFWGAREFIRLRMLNARRLSRGTRCGTTIRSNFEGTRAASSNKCLKTRLQIQINGICSHNSFGIRQMDLKWDIQKHP